MRRPKASPSTAGCQARPRPSRPSAAPLASNGKRIRLGWLPASGRSRLPLWELAGRPCSFVSPLACLVAFKPYSAEFSRVSRLFPHHPPVKPLSVRPAGGVWSKVGALSAPTPSSRHGAQGQSGMPKAPQSGGSRRRSVLDGPEHRGTQSYPQMRVPTTGKL